MFSGLLLIFIFFIFAALMYSKKLPALLALPAMAVSFGIVAQVSLPDILQVIVADGVSRLSPVIIVMLFGAMLAQFVKNSGIAEVLIKNVAEFSGDNPLVISFFLSILIALLFTVLGGLGAIMMVAMVVLPILLSLGIPNLTAACIFLLGLSAGGILNPANWQLYMTTLGLSQAEVFSFALPLFGLFFVLIFIFLLIYVRRGSTNFLLASMAQEEKKSMSFLALLTPFVPILLILGFELYNFLAKPLHPFSFPIVAAFIAGLIWGSIFIFKPFEETINLLTRSIFEGIAAVAPAIVLIMGIGMVLNAVMHPKVSAVIMPLSANILPRDPLGYIIFFAVLAPLSLYRGPLNIWGLGSGLIGIMLASGSVPAVAIMAAFMSVGQIQGVCDPTNTHNVWIANFLNVNVQDILKRTIIYVWILAIIGLVIAAMVMFSSPAKAMVPSEVKEENSPELVEIYRVKVINKASGVIAISTDEGDTWQKFGEVLSPCKKVNPNGYTASGWVSGGRVAASAVNAIHIKTPAPKNSKQGSLFSLVPNEMSSVNKNYNSYFSQSSNIYTNILAGESIFGAGFAPFVGSRVLVNGEDMPVDYVPAERDEITILVERPKKYPREIIFENIFGGKITIIYPGGEQKVIGEVLRPVVGVGRFSGTNFAAVGRIRANHPGVIDVSTSPLGKVGGFQIIPEVHAMSAEMTNARTKSQWMVVGPAKVAAGSFAGAAPLFLYFINPSYSKDDLDADNWQELFLKRFLVEVQYKDSKDWELMPEVSLDPDLSKPLPDFADTALEGVYKIKILFPVFD